MEQDSQKIQNTQHNLYLSLQENGRRCIVVPKASSSKEGSIVGLAKYAWSGYVLECQKCGVIYRCSGIGQYVQQSGAPPRGEQLNEYLCWSRSRQQWYGNTDPEYQGVVHTEIAHVWPGVSSQQLVFSVTETVTQVSRVRLLQELCGLICRF